MASHLSAEKAMNGLFQCLQLSGGIRYAWEEVRSVDIFTTVRFTAASFLDLGITESIHSIRASKVDTNLKMSRTGDKRASPACKS